MGETYIRAAAMAREIASPTEKGLESRIEASWDSCVSDAVRLKLDWSP
nr:hypothetical protein [uncultured Cohaesibacter sp.]